VTTTGEGTQRWIEKMWCSEHKETPIGDKKRYIAFAVI
jgi:hypothetical protein